MHRLPVIHVLPESGSDALQVRDVVRDFFDRCHLLLQVLVLNEIAQLMQVDMNN